MPQKSDRILKTINELEDYLSKLKEVSSYTLEQFQKDWNIYFAVERLIQLAVECLIEIGEDLISQSKFKKPETYRQTFEILEQHQIIKPELSKKLQNLASLRNKLVHAYVSVSLKKIYLMSKQVLSNCQDFIMAVKKNLKLRK